jgi:hypothetical protein
VFFLTSEIGDLQLAQRTWLSDIKVKVKIRLYANGFAYDPREESALVFERSPSGTSARQIELESLEGWMAVKNDGVSTNFKRHPSVEAKDFNNRLFSLFQGSVHSKVQALAQNHLTDFPKQSAVFVCP